MSTHHYHTSPSNLKFTINRSRDVDAAVMSQVSIPVFTQSDDWIAAEVLQDDFITYTDTIDSTPDPENITQAKAVLFACILSFVSQKLLDDVEYTKASTSLLSASFVHFVSTYISKLTHALDTDLYTFVNMFDVDVRSTILAAFFAACAALEQQGVAPISLQTSALLTAASNGDASIYALFGGQGTNKVYFDELQTLYNPYKPYISPNYRYHQRGPRPPCGCPCSLQLLQLWHGCCLSPDHLLPISHPPQSPSLSLD
ncbi:hypothetical protein SCLCIDRAFT_27586 [Scleroderma citrinum Foug A]|uniref:Fatty acid synthase subunit beta N-terminal domain-containing protein n=1 Tax=Scleroderma citrinum Foug A TaxID=1036808 RepID=A0A0C2ZAV3_9AGAM|nr:hypothetical protein SCLCIDRAFT_27586 [Scleroderma citrinum Foug A]